MNHHAKRQVQLPRILLLAICFALVACSGKNEEQVAAQVPVQTQKQIVTQKQVMKSSVDRLVQWPEKDLRNLARKAVMEQRWYKPSGNSALEYYLALRKKLGKPDESVETALVDILPYVIIGVDQAIATFNDKEALRLEVLIRMADPNAPALTRISENIEKIKARQTQAQDNEPQAEQEQLLDETKAKEESARKARQEEAARNAREQAVNREQVKTVAPTLTTPVAVAPPPLVPTAPKLAPQAPAPQPTPRTVIEPISTPQPPYPRGALLAGTKGEVVAEISIDGTGKVTNVRIISASPRNVFDKSVLPTVRRWKFRGNGESTTIRRTFVFN